MLVTCLSVDHLQQLVVGLEQPEGPAAVAVDPSRTDDSCTSIQTGRK